MDGICMGYATDRDSGGKSKFDRIVEQMKSAKSVSSS